MTKEKYDVGEELLVLARVIGVEHDDLGAIYTISLLRSPDSDIQDPVVFKSRLTFTFGTAEVPEEALN